MLSRFATALLFAVAAHAQFGMPFATNLEKSPNVSYMTVATNQPGRFIPGIPITADPQTWTGIRVHFQRDDRATDYRVEVTYLKNGAEATVIGYVRQHPAVLNGDGSAMLEAADVRISQDAFDFSVVRLWVSPLPRSQRTDYDRPMAAKQKPAVRAPQPKRPRKFAGGRITVTIERRETVVLL